MPAMPAYSLMLGSRSGREKEILRERMETCSSADTYRCRPRRWIAIAAGATTAEQTHILLYQFRAPHAIQWELQKNQSIGRYTCALARAFWPERERHITLHIIEVTSNSALENRCEVSQGSAPSHLEWVAWLVPALLLGRRERGMGRLGGGQCPLPVRGGGETERMSE